MPGRKLLNSVDNLGSFVLTPIACVAESDLTRDTRRDGELKRIWERI